eukprot:4781295-Amphidinium_carterae.1
MPSLRLTGTRNVVRSNYRRMMTFSTAAASDFTRPCVGVLQPRRSHHCMDRRIWPTQYSDAQHRRCGLVARALEECQPHEIVSDCKGVVKAVQALQTGRKHPKGRNSDLEQRALLASQPGQRSRWMETSQKQEAVDRGMVTADDLHGNGQAYELAKHGFWIRMLPFDGLTLRAKFTTRGAWWDRNFGRDLKLSLVSGYRPRPLQNKMLILAYLEGFFRKLLFD